MELTRDEVLMPDELIEIGRELFQSYLAELPPEERMAGLQPEQRVAGLPLEERLAGVPQDEIEEFLKSLR